MNRYYFYKDGTSSYEPSGYTLPSGGKETNESVLETAIRETAEEVGVSVAPEDTELVHSMSRKKPDGQEWIDVFFATSR